jgi:hypothetical protein
MNPLEEYLKGKPFTVFNTNNGWGFGGGIGKEYKVNGFIVRVGVACYRHLESQPYINVINARGERKAVDLTSKSSVNCALKDIKQVTQ